MDLFGFEKHKLDLVGERFSDLVRSPGNPTSSPPPSTTPGFGGPAAPAPSYSAFPGSAGPTSYSSGGSPLPSTSGGLGSTSGATGSGSSNPTAPGTAAGITNVTVTQDTNPAASGGEGMGFWGNMGVGLLAGAAFGGASAANQALGAQTARDLAETNTGLWETVSANNNATQKRLAEISADAGTDITRWQVIGMITNANTQYLQSVQYRRYMDQASRRAYFNERKQIAGESKVMTLTRNAEIHATRLVHDREMTKMEYDFQERIAASTTTTTG